jgi:hypothetical protein
LALRIVRGTIADVDSLEPLWVAVHHAHAASMPELAPYVSDAETWAQERPIYVALLGKPETVLLLAREGDELVGYALAHVTAVQDTWIPGPGRRGRGSASSNRSGWSRDAAGRASAARSWTRSSASSPRSGSMT